MSRIILQALRLALPDGSLLLDSTDLVLDRGVTALVGANGVGKSTLCRVLAGLQRPDGGRVHIDGHVALVDAQALHRRGGTVGDWLVSHPDQPSMARWLARLGLSGLPWTLSLDALSGGETTRLALAAALATPADFLLLDEPGAHLDRHGRRWLVDWLANPRRGVLLVSHQPDLLGTATRILELSGRRLHDHALDYAAYRAVRQIEQAAAERAVATARMQQARVRQQAQVARERADQRAAVGRVARRRGSQGALYFDYVKGRAEAGEGRRQRAAAERIDSAGQALAAQRERLSLVVDFDLRLSGLGPPAGKRLLQAEGLRATAADGRLLFNELGLLITGPTRIAIVGGNGSGKSWLLRLLAGHAAPPDGEVWRAPVPLAWIDQHADLPAPAGDLLLNLCTAQPDLREDTARERLAWFGFRGDQAAQCAATLSAGERIRLALCCRLGGPDLPAILLLDEPDNHLDLAARATVEHALRQYPGALLVASHDTAFLDAIGIERTIDLDAAIVS